MKHMRFFIQLFLEGIPGIFLRNGVLKICCKFTGEHPCQSAISIKLQSRWSYIYNVEGFITLFKIFTGILR